MNLAEQQFEALQNYVSNSADNTISEADELEIMEAQDRWELAKLKKKYEVAAEKDEC